jgi:hypothetical protein
VFWAVKFPLGILLLVGERAMVAVLFLVRLFPGVGFFHVYNVLQCHHYIVTVNTTCNMESIQATRLERWKPLSELELQLTLRVTLWSSATAHFGP